MHIPYQITVGEKEILGVAHIPIQHRESITACILCYGLNGHRVDEHRMCYKLGIIAEKFGCSVYRFDYRNAGVSEGAFENTSIKERIDDVEAVIDYVKACYGCKVNIVLIGYSDGAKVAAGVANKRNDISRMVLWNPVMKIDADVGNHGESFQVMKPTFSMHPLSKKPVASIYGLWFGTKLLTELRKDSSYELLKNMEIPILCIYGENDVHTERIRGKMMLDDVIMSHTEIKVVQNAGHTFNGPNQDIEVILYTIEWIVTGGHYEV